MYMYMYMYIETLNVCTLFCSTVYTIKNVNIHLVCVCMCRLRRMNLGLMKSDFPE